jgi:phosphoglucosamine mutase
LLIGGEQSGHIIVRDKLGTGDGVLNALHLAEIVASGNKKLSEYVDFELYKQCNINVRVDDKMRIINSAELTNMRDTQERLLGATGRIMLRVSGTEPYIRVMVETKDEKKSTEVAKLFEELIKELNKDDYICAE